MPTNTDLQQQIEALGPAEWIVQALTTYTDHLVHNRPGIVEPASSAPEGVRWSPGTWKEENGEKVVYKISKEGRRTVKVQIGVLDADGKTIKNGTRVVGEYRKPGLFPEAVVYVYKQIAGIYQMDNEFVAKLASWAFPREHRDLKVVLAAFMLVQGRKGDPILEDGELLFHDDDLRDVGQAMCLLRRKDRHDLNPKLLLRVGDILRLPGVAEINRSLGFGQSLRTAPMGRYDKVVKMWLSHRETNLPLLQGLVRAGFTGAVKDLARRVKYKPVSQRFFEILRWKQKQAKDGRRSMFIGAEVAKAESWEGLTEKQICERILDTRPNFKRVVGLLPSSVGLTRAVVAAAIEAGSFSDADLINFSPTLDELGLLEIPEIKARWKAALDKAENQRAAHIARNVKTKAVKVELEDAADKVAVKALEEVTRDLRIYVLVDKSGSMEGALTGAKNLLKKMLVGFPLERTHVSIFNTMGAEINIRANKAAAVEHAFSGHRAGGGTDYVSGIRALAAHKPQEGEDVLVFFIGDQHCLFGNDRMRLAQAIQQQFHGHLPVAFGLLDTWSGGRGTQVVIYAAQALSIPCFNIDPAMFGNDPYAVTRILRDLIAATPVGLPTSFGTPRRRVSLVEEILKTDLLQPPFWSKAT